MTNNTPASGPLPQTISPTSRACGFLLALLATGTSAWISVFAGIERGGRPSERFAWIAIGLVTLFGAHLIPSLTRGTWLRVRLPAMLLWLVCTICTGYGHSIFVLTAQEHAGDARAAALQHADVPAAAMPVSSGRGLDVIARDQAHVTQALANARGLHCTAHCEALTIRRESLSAQLAALNVEAAEARRRELAADRMSAAHDELKAREDLARRDPVTVRVAHLLNVSGSTVDLLVALTFGWLLEGVACLGWALALSGHSRDASPVTHQPVTASNAVTDSATAGDVPAQQDAPLEAGQGSSAAVMVSNVIGMGESNAARGSAVTGEPAIELLQLTAAIGGGQVRPTVKDIRRFLHCSQDRAMHLRRQVLGITGDSSRGYPVPGVRSREAASKPRLVHSATGQARAA
jgi:hypothetical protein